ncbi:alpha/beta fold hydrolase [Bdellovibrio sp. GT3]|uniref:alpha/beta fold hydrolase n=1 Tax=Bdellovibrio sp. GT3 TaxID=3136282 RepID=UPI0030F242F9
MEVLIKFGMEEKFIPNDEGQIHTLWQPLKNTAFILMIPGMFGVAEDCKEEFASLTQYSLAAMSVRGRGKSTRAFVSYTFHSQVSDVLAVIDSCPDENIILFAHSFGCLFAVAACEKRIDRIAGLILVDKGLIQNNISDQWLQRVVESPPQNSSIEIARKIHDEFSPVDLSGVFKSLNKPTLYFKGEKEGHALQEQEAKELEKLPNVQMVRLNESGHWPSESDYDTFIYKIQKFVASLGVQ